MMAKGQTICILNNDILVTPNWLSNLLNCLQSDDKIGMVGPVTNFISGEQLIEVPYQSIEDMYSFAATHNVPNAGKWQGTDRIVGFCLIFRRELFEATGYLDEGFEIGNFEDEDYVLRVRLNGRKLVIARDTFIHHYGSVTIRELGDQIESINDKNAAFFRDKWGNSFNLVQRAREANGGSGLARCHDFYPTHVAVTGLTDTVYWVEHGTKYPLAGHIGVPIVTVSQIDLRGWPTGPVMDAGLPVTNGSANPNRMGISQMGPSSRPMRENGTSVKERNTAKLLASMPSADGSWRTGCSRDRIKRETN